MTYTLWRGETLLGRFEERQPVTGKDDRIVGAAGVLAPTPEFSGTRPMMQVRMPTLPGAPVFQDFMEPIVLGDPIRSGGPRTADLEPMSDEEARGVSPDMMFEVRRADGSVVDDDMIMLRLYTVPDGVDAIEPRRENGISGDSREVWDVMFSKSPDDGV